MDIRMEMKSMSKKYGNFYANEDVSIALKKGEVHAIVGENGAGKTTLMRMLYGMEVPSSGEILVNGQNVSFDGPDDAIKHGIGMVHQHFMLFPDFTVSENIVIGHEPKKFGFFRRKEAIETVNKLSNKYGIKVNPELKTVKCSVGEQQRIEILKVLHQGAEIIILDEPTAVLTPLEVNGLLETIRHLAQQGKSIILITHKLNEVMSVADRITVLRNGKVTGVFNKDQTNVEELARCMVGRELSKTGVREKTKGKELLQVKNLTLEKIGSNPKLNSVNLTVHHGEILGIAGVSGNGQSELLQIISGVLSATSGSVLLSGKEQLNLSVENVRESGLAHIPEDRYLWGAAKEATVEEVAIMGHYRKRPYHRFSFIQNKVFRSVVQDWIDFFEVKTSSLKEKSGNLSGGNLQKLIVARELAQESPLLLAAEPTRGVDIGAMEKIHSTLLDKRNRGDGVLLVSSELSEILSLSDRILVMYEGEIVGEFPRHEATEERLSVLMAGGKSNDSSTKTAATI
ncbi:MULTISPECIES: ABC transporter ATP-binding protein [unclassified Bacillus (in: firmicutes)]|uniref:ABC transporter ATP-binding protein n=1 Tax=unclassified Bacillus (in: firmicutes) TaxID=185979 RepID=UPI0008ED392E|nr:MULTISPECIES: ABC transporter ATP-binding protein [unclassified Bacillus (in: firmicutes)]SFA87450.1 nucleoside ABC transporter ATP-binding protein [Bacillus sp. UNCCL13]SFQ84252.1 nucleoside ABC transporter ATP-binding protein [Bacillus sp. cl95]